MISRDDINLFNRTRKALKILVESTSGLTNREQGEGRVGEKAREADRALTDVLISAHVHTDSPITEDDLHLRKEDA